MRIAVIDTTIGSETTNESHVFLPGFIRGLTAAGHEVRLIGAPAAAEETFRPFEDSGAILETDLWQADGFVEETAPVFAQRLNALAPDVYLISASDDIGWVVLPMLKPAIATLAIGYTDSEAFYLPVRHYRAFLTRVVGVTPEVCVGYVLSCVLDKEKVEWISHDEPEPPGGGDENLRKIVESYENCFEKAVAEAKNFPRETYSDYPLMETCRSRFPLWLRKLKAKL